MRFRLVSTVASLAVVGATLAGPVTPPVRADLSLVQGIVTYLGAPVEGVVIVLLGTSDPTDPTTTSAADGTYALDTVSSTLGDNVLLQVTPPSPYAVGQMVKDGRPMSPNERFPVPPAAIVNIALVQAGHLAGTIADDAGAQVSGTATVCNTDDGVCAWPQRIAGGTYDFAVWSGHYTISFDLEEPSVSGYYAAGAAGRFSTSATAATRVAVAGVTMVPAVSVPTTKSVTGSVALASGGPASGVLRACEVATGHCPPTTLTDGNFLLDVPAGAYTLYLDLAAPAKDGWYSPAAAGHFVPAGGQGPVVTIAGDTTLPDITATVVHQVAGTATVAGGDGLTVELVTVGGSVVDAVDVASDTNAFTFPDVDAGTYKLHIPAGASNAAGWYSSSAASHVTRLETAASTITVTAATSVMSTPPMTATAAGAVSGTLQTTDGAPASGVLISAFNAVGDLEGSASTDDTGAFTVLGLVPGTYALGVNLDGASVRIAGGWYASSGPGFTGDRTARSTIAVSASDTVALGTLTAPRLYVASGTVFGPVHPAARIRVAICSVDETACQQGWTDADGQYAVGSLAAGTYTVSFRPDEGIRLGSGFYAVGTPGNSAAYGVDEATQLDVAADLQLDDVILPLAYRISGVLTNCPGCTALAFVLDQQDPLAQTLPQDDGSFSLMVAPGTYAVAFTAPPGAPEVGSGFYNGTPTLGKLPLAVAVTTSDVPLGTLAMPDSWIYSDTAPPEILSATPANGAVGIARNATLRVTFTEPVIGASGSTITLRDITTGVGLPATVTYVSGVATVRPSALLPVRHLVRLAVGPGITDVAGNPAVPHAFTFSVTSDGTEPYVSGKVPRPRATWVSRTANIKAVFSEAVTGVTSNTLRLKDKTTGRIIAAVVTYTAATRTAVLNPTGTLPAGHRFKVLTGAAIRDRAGNPIRATPWSFVTRR